MWATFTLAFSYTVHEQRLIIDSLLNYSLYIRFGALCDFCSLILVHNSVLNTLVHHRNNKFWCYCCPIKHGLPCSFYPFRLTKFQQRCLLDIINSEIIFPVIRCGFSYLLLIQKFLLHTGIFFFEKIILLYHLHNVIN